MNYPETPNFTRQFKPIFHVATGLFTHTRESQRGTEGSMGNVKQTQHLTPKYKNLLKAHKQTLRKLCSTEDSSEHKKKKTGERKNIST